MLNAHCVPYYLEESKAWGTDIEALRLALDSARSKGIDVRAIAVINPGNPTGASLSLRDLRAVLEFAAKETLVVIADEVYQTNVFEGEFLSFKKVLRDLQKEEPAKYANIELVSLHSISKGMVGECGHRGGFFELVGFDPEVVQQIYKFVSINLCPPVIGQCLVELMVNPPQKGDPSYDLYKKEYDQIFEGLRERAFALYDAFKHMEGVDCQRPQVCCVALPSGLSLTVLVGIHVPFSSYHSAGQSDRRSKERGSEPDEFYCSRLLDATGICLVARKWIWAEARNTAFPDDVSSTGHRMGWSDNEIPQGFHE